MNHSLDALHQLPGLFVPQEVVFLIGWLFLLKLKAGSPVNDSHVHLPLLLGFAADSTSTLINTSDSLRNKKKHPLHHHICILRFMIFLSGLSNLLSLPFGLKCSSISLNICLLSCLKSIYSAFLFHIKIKNKCMNEDLLSKVYFCHPS